MPFTLLFLLPTNARLIEGSAGKAKIGDAEVRELVTRWGRINAVRAIWPILGVMVGIASVL